MSVCGRGRSLPGLKTAVSWDALFAEKEFPLFLQRARHSMCRSKGSGVDKAVSCYANIPSAYGVGKEVFWRILEILLKKHLYVLRGCVERFVRGFFYAFCAWPTVLYVP